jgi:putative DNA primase/helicase
MEKDKLGQVVKRSNGPAPPGVARGKKASAGGSKPPDPPDIEPWPDPVEDGAALLHEIAAAVSCHVVMGEAASDAVALWCGAVPAFQAFDIFPRLFVTAPTRQAGKTLLLDVIRELVPRPMSTSHATVAALFRLIPLRSPTLLLDEADAWAQGNEDLRAVLNGGHRRGSPVWRCVGDEHEPRPFDVYCPAVLAAIGQLHATLEDRAIVIELRRKLPTQSVPPLREGRPLLRDLARKAARWIADHGDQLRDSDPAMPPGLANRAADNWAPLFAVADLAGGEWPERARRVALSLSGGERSHDLMLLADVRQVFGPDDRVSSEELAKRLNGLDGRPWGSWDGWGMSKAKVSHMLATLGIYSKTIRLADGKTPKGYYRADFADAWRRYLPPDTP